MPTPYLSLAEFKNRADLIPPEDVDWIESRYPGFVEQMIASWSSWINARLKKRYAVPFVAPVPEVVLIWLTALVTRSCWSRRGANAADAYIVDMKERAAEALADVKEAADSKDGLFDLPLSDSAGDDAVVAGGPLGYAEQSPYTWTDIEAQNARDEDATFGPPTIS